MVVGSNAKVFFSGMPSEAAGPVAATETPTLMSASTAVDRVARTARVSFLIMISSRKRKKWSLPRAAKSHRGRARGLLVLLGQLPAAILDIDHDAGALVEAEVVVGAHVVDAMRAGDILGRLQRIAQGGTEFLAAWLRFLQGDGGSIGEQNAGIPGIATKGIDAALAVHGFIFGDVLAG